MDVVPGTEVFVDALQLGKSSAAMEQRVQVVGVKQKEQKKCFLMKMT